VSDHPSGLIDFHSHVIPAVDDGAADPGQAREALLAMREQGIGTVVATPHLNGSDTTDPTTLSRWLEEVDRGWAELEAVAAGLGEPRILRGAEVMLDTATPDLSDPRVRLAGTDFVLVEFPFMTVPPGAANVFFELRMKGWAPVLAHPERYSNAEPGLEDAREWVRMGAHLQVNAGSLLGRYGEDARRLGWGLLGAGLVSYVCTDYHARGHCHAAEARAALVERGAAEQAALLMEVNPGRLLEGLPPLEVPAIARPSSVWRRLFGR